MLDVCSGAGQLQLFLPAHCSYTGIDASPEFVTLLRKKGAKAIHWNLHLGWPASVPASDVITMVISLSQFRTTSAERLLETFKTAAKRVVIVEEVLPHAREQGSLIQRGMNYLCHTDYYVPVASWYTRSEFEQLMQHHGYQCEVVSSRYMVGSYSGEPHVAALRSES